MFPHVRKTIPLLTALLTLCLPYASWSNEDLHSKIDSLTGSVESNCISIRRQIHQNPELSGEEYETAALIASELRSMGIEVQEGVGGTGVVGLLRGKSDFPVVALRADMDALPMPEPEKTDIPFASIKTTRYNGKEVNVMHACGHDCHVAILLSTARVVSEIRDELNGSVKFIFQPAEESGSGALAMIEDGVLESPRPDAIFALHVWPNRTGTLAWRTKAAMASADFLRITLKGKAVHASTPWKGKDPFPAANQIYWALQELASHELDLTRSFAVITIGTIHGGTRSNITMGEIEMTGTIRTFDADTRKTIHRKIIKKAQEIAGAFDIEADVYISKKGLPVTYNDPDLTAIMETTLKRIAGKGNWFIAPPAPGAEDFAFFAREIPGLYIYLGITPEGKEPTAHHSLDFYADESAFVTGIRTLSNMVIEYFELKGQN